MSNAIITREYKGDVFTFRADGYFNMASAAKKFGKFLPNFMRSPETTDYMEALSSTVNSTALEIVDVVPGNLYVEGRGTWAHPKLAVFFARWLDVKFAVWCDMVIDDILSKKAELTITKPAESAAMKVPQSFPEALRLAAELAERNQQLEVENAFMHDELHLVTMDEYRSLTHRYFDPSYRQRLQWAARKLAKDRGITLEKALRLTDSQLRYLLPVRSSSIVSTALAAPSRTSAALDNLAANTWSWVVSDA
ncbi:KilA-N domain-containing protein [Pseudomonas knackmussii]|uniref:KilA-N domain-containing protein n=1 Tax=Pseudomonas knackmussii TaxID=65741 RepID=UPI003F4A333B